MPRTMATKAAAILYLALSEVALSTDLCLDGACDAGEESTLLQVQSRKAASEVNLKPLPSTPTAPGGDSPSAFQMDWVKDLLGSVLPPFPAAEPKSMPRAGSHCEVETFNCSAPSSARRCPELCGVQGKILNESSSQRGSGRDKARERTLSRLQSMSDEYAKDVASKGETPPDTSIFHEVVLLLDAALQKLESEALKDLKRSFSSDAYDEFIHITYLVTIVEAFLVKWHLLSWLGVKYEENSYSKLFAEFADVVEAKGYDSPEAKSFFEADIFLSGGVMFPADLGWSGKYFSNLKVLALNGNLHTYRKVPYAFYLESFGYDYDFSVYSLPDDKDLKVGIVGDWGSGTPQAIKLIQEMKKSADLDLVVHLGDVYYSGTLQQEREYFLEPMRATFGESMPIYTIPGNHDYYDGGAPFFDIIDDLGIQEASFFCLRGKTFQIVALDTGLFDNFDLLGFALGFPVKDIEHVMAFLPDDQSAWALHQLEVGRKTGLKTIMMSHHQFFSRSATLGVPNSEVWEASMMPDRQHGTFETSEFEIKAPDLPGHLPAGVYPSLNTRLAKQFPPEVLEHVDVWFWGHEHALQLFEPYAGLKRGRLVGNSAIGWPKEYDYFAPAATNSTPWGGPPGLLPGSKVGHGTNFWALSYAVMTLSGSRKSVSVDYYQMKDSRHPPEESKWGDAEKFFTETF